MAYKWFIEVDDFTNEAVARFLASDLAVDTDAQQKVCFDKHGKKKARNLWECKYGFIEKLLKARNVEHNIKIFKQKGQGKIREFDEKIFSKKRVLAKRIKEELTRKHLSRS